MGKRSSSIQLLTWEWRRLNLSLPATQQLKACTAKGMRGGYRIRTFCVAPAEHQHASKGWLREREQMERGKYYEMAWSAGVSYGIEVSHVSTACYFSRQIVESQSSGLCAPRARDCPTLVLRFLLSVVIFVVSSGSSVVAEYMCSVSVNPLAGGSVQRHIGRGFGVLINPSHLFHHLHRLWRIYRHRCPSERSRFFFSACREYYTRPR